MDECMFYDTQHEIYIGYWVLSKGIFIKYTNEGNVLFNDALNTFE